MTSSWPYVGLLLEGIAQSASTAEFGEIMGFHAKCSGRICGRGHVKQGLRILDTVDGFRYVKSGIREELAVESTMEDLKIEPEFSLHDPLCQLSSRSEFEGCDF